MHMFFIESPPPKSRKVRVDNPFLFHLSLDYAKMGIERVDFDQSDIAVSLALLMEGVY